MRQKRPVRTKNWVLVALEKGLLVYGGGLDGERGNSPVSLAS